MNNFKFGFSSEDDSKDLSSSVLDSTNTNNELEWFTAKEIFASECKELNINNKQQLTFKVNNFKIQYLYHTEEDDSITENNINGDDHSDLIPAKYEGGLKIWECTFDLASYLTSSEKPVNLEKKRVLDLGCGTGVIGLVALRLGAEVVHFQDYNEDVLRQATIPNVSLNNEAQFSSCKFYSGDWASFSDLDDFRYDVILTCETIYNVQNNRKLHDTLRKKLKKNGIVLLAAKTYYFGVGGGTRLFESLVEEEGVFSSEVCWKCSAESTNTNNELEWFNAKEIFANECKELNINNKQQLTFKVNNFKIQYLYHTEDDSATEKNINGDDLSDLIPAKYEGGLKIWECTSDLASYLTSSEKPVNLEKKTVLDLGCGTGVIGLVALRLGAEVVHFQDYNEDVLRQATIPNVSLNNEAQFSSCKFYSGDWASFSDLDDFRYDVILTCETIYNVQNNRKLHDTLRKKLEKNGIVLLAAKTYYFGVGGGTRLFESLVEEEGVFSSEVCWKCTTGVHREILKLKFKDAT